MPNLRTACHENECTCKWFRTVWVHDVTFYRPRVDVRDNYVVKRPQPYEEQRFLDEVRLDGLDSVDSV